ncbi:hypothetical protein [Variovorax rhizosphaerae]|uniref:HTH-like domain-containing protein n=1 Tax=Variovorax rhizosphaerae TaxID=1836200 RepID=A0ABU8X0X2_9BURK
MHRELKARGHRIGLRRVERLMREHGVRGAAQAALQGDDALQALDAGSAKPAGAQLHAWAPNRVWTGDITYIQTGEGWL